MIFILIGGVIALHLFEKKTTEMVHKKRLAKLRMANPELCTVQTQERIYLTEEQKILGEGGDAFLFATEAPLRAMEIVQQERDAAEALARAIRA